ncbi:ATP-binding protein [Actinoplanes regularis]|uniref:ATP-binding protein n=1 Tax=Actinoplanes regularis TaxID=52697 RepID=UPI00249FB053|nr:ATP-binding protein [Actinoplanes regularis]GLW36055.1 hypothetical protein Areg01_89890 [Actinoplanes regularis]
MTPVLLRQWTLDQVHELRTLRTGLREQLDDPELLEWMTVIATELCERMAVVATELATNALRHGRPPVVVRLLAEPSKLTLDVSDLDLVGEPTFDSRRPIGQGGLGLLLVRSFAAESGWYRSDHAKHIWASFQRSQ